MDSELNNHVNNENDELDEDDPIFQEIGEKLSAHQSKTAAGSDTCEVSSLSDSEVQTTDNFVHWPYGFQPKAAYKHAKKSTNMMGVSYNGRMKQLVITDSRGVIVWNKDSLTGKGKLWMTVTAVTGKSQRQDKFDNVCDLVKCGSTHTVIDLIEARHSLLRRTYVDNAAQRAMTYPKYQYGLIVDLIYARKYNVYFALWKDFSVKVLNREFEETCSVLADMRCVLFMLFNPITDELITGGFGGLKVWSYQQVTDETWTDIKAMANYRLKLKYTLPQVGGSWVKRVSMDLTLQHLYCCSETDLLAYDMEGNKLFQFERAHAMSITGCVYSVQARLLVTSSRDTEVKCWSIAGGLIHTFRGHSRDVTNIVLHPEMSALFLTSSLDGTVRLWSLDTMDMLYSMTISSLGVQWMGLTDDKLLYAGTIRNVTIWSLNTFYSFWALARSKITKLSLVQADNKSTRVMALGDDSSVRLFARSSQKNLSTVLPPPPISPLESVLCVTYSRALSTVYLLINTRELWIYTTRTDPASRVAVWDVLKVQAELLKGVENNGTSDVHANRQVSNRKNKGSHGSAHRATENGSGNDSIALCHCVCYLDSPAMMWAEDGYCCPVQTSFLLFGLEDGRIFFMDPITQGKKYMEFKVNKDAVRDLRHNVQYNTLISFCRHGEDATVLQIWALPTLDLLSEVYCPADLTVYTQLNSSIMTGHQSGMVLLHLLTNGEKGSNNIEQKIFLASETGLYGDDKYEHQSPVLVVDSCQCLGIFFSASPDGSIKVWDETKKLLTEITLDHSLSAACFLNSKGDILIGFKNHIFFLDHSKVCPFIPVEETIEDENDAESDIYEDPAVKYEGVSAHLDTVDMDIDRQPSCPSLVTSVRACHGPAYYREGWHVPFHLDFSSDFLEGKTSAVTTTKAPEEEEDEYDSELMSQAPTELYLSPPSTPRQLSFADLSFSSPVLAGGTRSPRVSFNDTSLLQNEPYQAFEMPVFGVSPGPTPSPSPPSSPCTPSSFDISSGGESTPAESETEDDTKFKPISIVTKSKPAFTIKEPIAVLATKVEPGHVNVSRMAAIKIDSAALLKQEAKKQVGIAVDLVKKEADHSHSKQALKNPSTASIKKKQFTGQRKFPKHGERPQRLSKSSGEETKASLAKKTRPKTRVLRNGVTTHSVGLNVTENDDSDQEITGIGSTASPRRSSLLKARQQKPDNFKLDVKPKMKVGAGATSGVQKQPGTVSSRKKTMMEFEGPPILGKSPTAELQEQDHEDLEISGDNVTKGVDALTAAPKLGPEDNVTVQAEDKHPGNSEQLLLRPESNLSHSASHFSKGRSSTMFSEAGSEWTVPAAENLSLLDADDHEDWEEEEDEEENPLKQMDFLEHLSFIAGHREIRPTSGSSQMKRGFLDDANLHRRPHTSMEFTPEKMEALYSQFEDLLARYKGIPGTPDYIEHLYQNDGKKFGPNWHHKMAERHLLMKMQHHLRAQSAKAKHCLLDAQSHRIRRQSHPNPDPPPSIQLAARRIKSDSGLRRPKSCQTFRTVSCHRQRTSATSSYACPSTRAKSARPLERPHTAASTCRTMTTPAPSEAQTRQNKRDLSKELPFRVRLGRDTPPVPGNPPEFTTQEELRLLDPRNPASRAVRPHSSKSIPSKCNHYILITAPKDTSGKIIPTRLESRLISQRFPKWKERAKKKSCFSPQSHSLINPVTALTEQTTF